MRIGSYMGKMKKQRVWIQAKPSSVPESLRDKVSEAATELVEKHIKPQHIKPPPKYAQFNYIEDIFTKWKGRYFYFMTRYACVGPNRISPNFEIGFARLEFVGDERFNLAYFRHTGKWWQVFSNLSLEDALKTIKTEPYFQP